MQPEKKTPIPKKIHTVWVGNKPFPFLVQRCFSSWKKYAPDVPVTIWTEENSPMNHPYVRKMYAQKKWAFVADYIRFWVLYHEGGVYLDTDMEILRSIDPLFENTIFFGKTSSDGFISCGIIGAEPGHFFVKMILDWYDADTSFSIENTSPKIVTACFNRLTKEQQSQITIFSPDIFYPCNAGEKCSLEKLGHAYTNHHWAESWVSVRWLRRMARRFGLLAMLKKIL